MFELLPEETPQGPQPALLALPGPTSQLRGLIPEPMLVRHRCLPLKVIDNLLVLALPEPHDQLAIEDVILATGLAVEPVPLRGFEPLACEVQALVTGSLAFIDVVQTFTNHFTEGMEAVYSFPLPDGTLHAFGVGEQEARTVGSAWRAELGAVPPGETVRVHFRYLQRLESRLCEQVLRLPAVPGMAVRVDLETGGRTLRRLAASEALQRPPAPEACLRFETRTDQGLVFRFGFQSAELGAVLFTHGEHFLLELTPPLELARPPQPRDVSLVLDCSERMAGERWSQALAAVRQLLDALEPGDRLRVLLYNDKVVRYQQGEAVRAEEACALEAFLRGVLPHGPDSALQRAVDLAWERAGEREPYLIFVGSPDHRCLGWKRPPRRFLGIGHSGADQAFLAPFGPFARLSEPASVTRLLRELSRPVLADVRLEDRGLNFMTEGLGHLGDLHAARALHVSGWKLGPGAVEVQGRRTSGEAWSQRVEPVASRNPALKLAWALGRSELLERRGGADAEVLRLCRDHGLPSRLTRVPAVERPVTEEDGRIIRVVNLILSTALADRATHIHFEKVVHYRVDGVLHEVMTPPEWVRAAICARFRALCGASAESPGQGTFSLKHDGRDYDVGVSFVTTPTGEKLTAFLRPAVRPPTPLPEPLRELLGREGLVFLSPELLPHAVAYHQESRERHVVVYGKALRWGEGPTYLEGRTRLPLDTDVLVGDAYCDEMLEVTRAIAGASSTDVMLTLTRLQAHPELCARVRGVAAERRIRRSCGCRAGCERCKETGFFGEIRLFEVLPITPEVRAALDGPTGALLAVAGRARRETFVQQARAAADRGETSFAEVVRVFGAAAHEG